jgi:cytochrome c peroxidase
MGGTDNLKSSIGHNWNQGPINSPTVLNSRFNLAQFWDGRAKDLKAQAGGPIANPGEMGSTHKLAVEVVASIPAYQQEFKQAFGAEGVDIDKITTAIAEFEKTLVTPNSRFDQWLTGKKDAITKQEEKGYQLFKSSGCVACHNGVAVGGNSYQKVGAITPYKTDNKATGRFDVTKKESDKFLFKVPTLRNIELTYPYFHDGNVATLTDAVRIMGKIQLAKEFSEEENASIVAFLKTLTGDQPSFKLPILPPSVDKTPKPVPFK